MLEIVKIAEVSTLSLFQKKYFSVVTFSKKYVREDIIRFILDSSIRGNIIGAVKIYHPNQEWILQVMRECYPPICFHRGFKKDDNR